MGSDTPSHHRLLRRIEFQSTLPHGERPNRYRQAHPTNDFNPRSRMGSDTALRMICLNAACNFNPRSRMGSDRHPGQTGGRDIISIHAPAWGATRRRRRWCERCCHFNPRSRMGSDPWMSAGTARARYFNPRSRMGSDPVLPITCTVFLAISIHAPAWGATTAATQRLRGKLISIHAPAWGATVGDFARYASHAFQSTLPHGERPARPMYPATLSTFQSTLPHGERPEAQRVSHHVG